jgi:hypothetical protein
MNNSSNDVKELNKYKEGTSSKAVCNISIGDD